MTAENQTSTVEWLNVTIGSQRCSAATERVNSGYISDSGAFYTVLLCIKAGYWHVYNIPTSLPNDSCKMWIHRKLYKQKIRIPAGLLTKVTWKTRRGIHQRSKRGNRLPPHLYNVITLLYFYTIIYVCIQKVFLKKFSLCWLAYWVQKWELKSTTLATTFYYGKNICFRWLIEY